MTIMIPNTPITSIAEHGLYVSEGVLLFESDRYIVRSEAFGLPVGRS